VRPQRAETQKDRAQQRDGEQVEINAREQPQPLHKTAGLRDGNALAGELVAGGDIAGDGRVIGAELAGQLHETVHTGVLEAGEIEALAEPESGILAGVENGQLPPRLRGHGAGMMAQRPEIPCHAKRSHVRIGEMHLPRKRMQKESSYIR